jgi:POT family proton-dependent oligopeptide transporter
LSFSRERAQQQPDHLNDQQAEAWYHTFVSAAYFLPLAGAFLVDAILGKFRTVLLLSIVLQLQ